MGNNNTSNAIEINKKYLNTPFGKKFSSYPTRNLLSALENLKQQGKIDNIKSKYILKNIFDNINKKQTLKIINYNKKIQNRLNISIKDYKEFSEIYSTIEIEIIPKRDLNYSYDFIHISNKNIHVYFNNNIKEEVNKYSINKNDKVEKIKVVIDYQLDSFYNLFKNCDCIESISFTKFTRNNITNMGYMFYNCSSLKKINFYNFNTENVTSMIYMFYKCVSSNKLDLSKFNTEKVIDIQHIFDCCTSLKEFKISNFNTKNVVNMNNMFTYCNSLSYIPIKNFDTSNVE